MIYLASPYAHASEKVRNSRAREACKAAAHLMAKGVVVYSPIAHGHAVQDHLPPSLACSHKFWLPQCFQQIAASDHLYVLCLNGWVESRGVAWEMQTARVLGLPVLLMRPDKNTYKIESEN